MVATGKVGEERGDAVARSIRIAAQGAIRLSVRCGWRHPQYIAEAYAGDSLIEAIDINRPWSVRASDLLS